MLTSEYVSCTGVYKSLAASLNSGAPCTLVVGGPGCGKSTFTLQFLSERGYMVANVSDICDRDAMTRRVKTFCDTGGVDSLVQRLSKNRVVWIDDNLQMGTIAISSASAFGVPVFATCSARAISKFPTLRRRCNIVKMNYPSKPKCVELLKTMFPGEDVSRLESIAAAVNGSVPRAISAVNQSGVSDYIEDRRKMDMSVYEIAESTVKIARDYSEVKIMTSSEPVMFSLILQEMSAKDNNAALKACVDVLALGSQELAEISCFSGFLYAGRRSKAKFPRCYSLASSKSSALRKMGEICSNRGLIPWESAFLYVKKW